MDKKVLIMLAVLVVALVTVTLNGKITGNAFAYNLPKSCTDSDGGKNPEKAGVVDYKGLSSVRVLSYADECRDKKTLIEHYCDQYTEHKKESIPCRDGSCKDGACLPLYK